MYMYVWAGPSTATPPADVYTCACKGKAYVSLVENNCCGVLCVCVCGSVFTSGLSELRWEGLHWSGSAFCTQLSYHQWE